MLGGGLLISHNTRSLMEDTVDVSQAQWAPSVSAPCRLRGRDSGYGWVVQVEGFSWDIFRRFFQGTGCIPLKSKLVGCFKDFLFSPRTLVFHDPIWLLHNFSIGLVQPPTSKLVSPEKEIMLKMDVIILSSNSLICWGGLLLLVPPPRCGCFLIFFWGKTHRNGAEICGSKWRFWVSGHAVFF